jgi:hypothetical protein
MSNYRQEHIGLTLFLDDHRDYLPPGPEAANPLAGLLEGQFAYYDSGSTGDLAYYLASYLGYHDPDNTTRLAKILVCPGYQHANVSQGTLTNPVCYLLAGTNVDNQAVSPFTFLPFGSTASGGTSPNTPSHKITEVAAVAPPSSVWYIADVDQWAFWTRNAQHNPWYLNTALANSPVHGSVRNHLYFDGHVQTKKAIVPPTGGY